jgi:predicted nucleic acid-binding protein
MLYLDSSAAVKLYVREVGTEVVRAATGSLPLVSVRLSFVEVLAALAAAARLGRVADFAAPASAFRAHWRSYVVIEVDRLLAESAADLAVRHALRGYDAVQLAAALSAAGAEPASLTFASFDVALSRAAAAEGMRPLV